MASQAWNVYRDGRCIDTVFFTSDCDKEFVRRALIHHDGYHPSITVRRRVKGLSALYPPAKDRKVWRA